ncbi:hypothetical protein BDY19DRAFT_930343 [Irpex rosettiformis]|uniref:Uncharacterized protein n=1 Tax=Irpex rosettiformis TaxID=378272 RepID=A0ACB8UB62_9APHY|nr:hypothetical protein BDY19DRAFT_930343 [Irpex rosettiformis]
MAQPVFDEHPLGEYFRESGDVQEIMPGSHPEYYAEPSENDAQQVSPLGSFVLRIVERAQVSILVRMDLHVRVIARA